MELLLIAQLITRQVPLGKTSTETECRAIARQVAVSRNINLKYWEENNLAFYRWDANGQCFALFHEWKIEWE